VVETARPLVVRAGSLTVVLRNQFPDLRHKLARNRHDCLGGLNTGFVLHQSVLIALLLVVASTFRTFSAVHPSGKFSLLIAASFFCVCEMP
jgi:hypothetical protein